MNPQLTRPIYWNVEFPGIDLFIPVVGILLVAGVVYGFFQRVRMWRALGQPEIRWDRTWERLLRVVRTGFGQRRILTHSYGGKMHTLILVGFVLLFIGTVLVAIERDICQKLLGIRPVAFLFGHFYSVFSFILDLAGVMVVVGCLMALYRRAFLKPRHLYGNTGFGKWTVFLLVVTLTGFYVEAARIAHSAFVIEGDHIVEAESALEKWASPIGYMLSLVLPSAAVSPKAQHLVMWWGHAVLSLGFILGFAYSILLHAFTGPANIFFARFESTGALQPIANMEEAESFGVTTLDQFGWKTLFDSDVCVKCGRCELHCPATITGKPLSPKRIMVSIRKVWEPVAGKLAAGEAVAEFPALVGNAITEDEIWSCTTCGACMRECPLFIEHIPAILDLRRARVMMESSFPSEAQITLQNLEKAGNPWGLDNSARADWAKGLEVPTLEQGAEPEILLWVGCAGSFDVRAKPATRALAKILKAANVSFAILGKEEQCCGDPARRIGHEYLYVTLAQMAVETLNGYGVKRIVTGCPHCFHTLANEYPQLGGRYEVLHHSEYVDELIRAGRLAGIEIGESLATVYHDSCYLGRHNDIYEEPRNLARAAGLELAEMQRTRERSFCCGAGGGRMWMEEHLGDRKINIERSEEVIASGAKQVAVACPFCKTMLKDGLKEKGREDLQVFDIAELVAERISG
ncbi:MAG: (Fe-S)-binding protein [Candidatus Omnitrophica bacterium]|nr:(Fe-S)-binding protein [Candidatus Omnitrophota bacterium]